MTSAWRQDSGTYKYSAFQASKSTGSGPRLSLTFIFRSLLPYSCEGTTYPPTDDTIPTRLPCSGSFSGGGGITCTMDWVSISWTSIDPFAKSAVTFGRSKPTFQIHINAMLRYYGSLTNRQWMAWEREGPPNRIAFPSNKYSNCRRSCPGQDEELVLAHHQNERFHGYHTIYGLADREKRDHLRILHVNHVVIFRICNAKIVARLPCESGPRLERDVLLSG